MGYIVTNKNVDLGSELNEMISSLGYEVEINPDDEETEEKEDEEEEN